MKSPPLLFGWKKPIGNAKDKAHGWIERVLMINCYLQEGGFAVRTKTGETRIWDFSSAPLGRLPDGRHAIVVMASDVTERKRTEQALRDNEAALRQQLEELRESHRCKGEILALLAHELRNSLMPITNAVAALRLQRNGMISSPLHWTLDMMDRHLRQLTRLVDDLLDAARITHGKIELHKEPIALVEVIGCAVEMVKPRIQERRQNLTVSIADKTLRLAADPARLTQVICNLLDNAAKYTAMGGAIWLTAEPAKQDLIIKVRDNGLGIPSEGLRRIFDPFFQAHPSLGCSQRGLGLGLTLVRDLVALHGGSVQVTSDGLGCGSEFLVRLPLLDLSQERSAKPLYEGLNFELCQ